MDAFGGYEAFQEIREKTRHKHFDYIWGTRKLQPDQRRHDLSHPLPLSGWLEAEKGLHLYLALWTLPELQELLIEAGFARVTVYWEEVDEKTGDGTGVYSPATVGAADPGWVCFIVAEK